MTRMTETITGEIHFYKPKLGTALREIYERAQAGDELTGTEAAKLSIPYAMEFYTVKAWKPYKAGKYTLRGEWHDFIYYPASQVNRIEAEEFDRDDYQIDDDVTPDSEL